MNPTIALLPSALLGPAVWQPVRDQLRAAGRDVIVTGEQTASGTTVEKDAILPPQQGTTPVAPQGLREMLHTRTGRDGKLPVWTSWWPPEEVAAAIARLL